MPTYEYVCRKCEHRFERFQSIMAKPIRKCPSCGKTGVQRLVSAGAGIIFKGSGFYQTDYRSESYKKGADKEKSPTSKDTEKNVTTPESKETKSGEKIEAGKREKKKKHS